MVLPVLRPMTIAAATGLVAGGVFTSFATVCADETNGEEKKSGFDHDHRTSHYPHVESRTRATGLSSDHRGTGLGSHYRTSSARSSQRTTTRSNGEELMPGLVYVALAGLTGSFIASRQGALMKTLSPVAFASAAGYYFLPQTTRGLLGVDSNTYDKWAHPSSNKYASSSYTTSSSSSALPRSELASKAREAWHTAEVKVDRLDEKIDQSAKEAKGWVEDKSRLIEKTVSASAKEADSWWKAQGASSSGLHDKSETQQTWFHHKGDGAPAETYHPSEHKHWWSSRSKASGIAGVGLGASLGVGLEEPDHWSNGEEQGTAKIRETSGRSYWFGGRGYTDDLLDNKDVDRWSSTEEEIGTAHLDETRYANLHHHRHWDPRDLHREAEYWTNGEEMSNADVRDPSYYNWAGGIGSSLSRTSWWDRRSRSSGLDFEGGLRDPAESLAWEAKQAADKAAADLANQLALEQSELEKKAANARARAEAAARQAKASSEALIRERQISMEKSAREMEQRLLMEREAADRAAADIKARAQAWELEQRNLAERAAKEVNDRVLREKAAAEADAAQIKAKAEAWAREQKEKADLAAKEIHERVLRETAAAERSALEAKAAMEARLREEKISIERTARDLEERIHIEKAKEDSAEKAEAAALAAKNRAESLLIEKKRSAEQSAKEMADVVARESTAKIERDARLRAQMDGLKSELHDTARAASASSGNWSFPWGSSRSETTTSTTHTHDHSHDGFDSTGQLLEHIVEDIKQTKEDIQEGLGHLKDAVLGAESNASEASSRVREAARTAARDAANAASTERRSWWSSGSDLSSKATEVGRNVEATAAKAERDVKDRADTVGKSLSDTAQKAYHNVIDAATTGEGQSLHGGHNHGAASRHSFFDHIRDDLHQVKKDFEETVSGAEHAANKASANVQQAADEGKKWWNTKSTSISNDIDRATSDAQAKIDKAAKETKYWWSSKTHEAEKTANRLDSELRAGLNKAGDKIREMDRGLDETLNGMAGREASDDYWFHAEQNRQQSRGSGRAM
ncbi:hypothetical protein EMPS_09452 [Entomortierella parvispora]|uniref:MICOS complex subunit n=1 Tax=Entomortierella parvispora TaxID=205924 RepID=A0A9P3M0B4_9FUNG|nr:hypothetical protein EMPS_09452 [Entomortierella parvispora]